MSVTRSHHFGLDLQLSINTEWIVIKCCEDSWYVQCLQVILLVKCLNKTSTEYNVVILEKFLICLLFLTINTLPVCVLCLSVIAFKAIMAKYFAKRKY